MKLETIKRNNKKKIIIGSMIVLSVVGCLTLTTTRAKYRNVQSIKLATGTVNYKASDFSLIAINVSEDGESYINSSVIPIGSYQLNTIKSVCLANGVEDKSIKMNYYNGVISFDNITKQGTKCELYFDRISSQLSSDILAKGKEVTKSGNPDFSVVATGTETDDNNGIYVMDDPMYGENAKTYYWRGAATTNHVIFANKCWRIIRINGDGTIRLIYNGSIQNDNICFGNGSNLGSLAVTNQMYYTQKNRSEYVGWTYSEGSQRPVDNLLASPSNIKYQVENWYDNNIGNNSNFDLKVAIGKYCNDRDVASDATWSSQPYSTFNYAFYQRLHEYQPSLSCNKDDVYNLKVGAITGDESMLAGGVLGGENKLYYLYNGQHFWTMTPYYYYAPGQTAANVLCVQNTGELHWSNGVTYSTVGIRPVINLRSDVTFNADSDGTSNNPYIVQ